MSWIAEEVEDFISKEAFKISSSRDRYSHFREFIKLLGKKYGVNLTSTSEHGGYVSIESTEKILPLSIFEYLDQMDEDIKTLKKNYKLLTRKNVLYVLKERTVGGFLRKKKIDNYALIFDMQRGSLSFYTEYLKDENIKNFVDKIAHDIFKIPNPEEVSNL